MQLECARILHDSLLVPVLTSSSETTIWREKGRSRIRAVQMDNLRVLLGIRRMDKVLNEDEAVVRGDEGCRRKD